MELVLVILALGGWGAVLIYGDNKKEISGAKKNTTNNIKFILNFILFHYYCYLLLK